MTTSGNVCSHHSTEKSLRHLEDPWSMSNPSGFRTICLSSSFPGQKPPDPSSNPSASVDRTSPHQASTVGEVSPRLLLPPPSPLFLLCLLLPLSSSPPSHSLPLPKSVESWDRCFSCHRGLREREGLGQVDRPLPHPSHSKTPVQKDHFH